MVGDCSEQGWMNRAAAFELAAMAFLPTSRELSGALASGEYAEACEEVLAALGADADGAREAVLPLEGYAGSDADAVFHVLRCEHTRMFVGEKMPPVTPYAGMWKAQQRGQDALYFVGRDSIEIERFMRRCGVAKDLPGGHVNDPVDHVGTMCEFAKLLCLVKARAVEQPTGACIGEDDFDSLMDEHFREFASAFAGMVRGMSREPFFCVAAGILEAACGCETAGAASAGEE